MRTAIMTLAAAMLVTGSPTATEVYWTPAHDLAPATGILDVPAACDLDRDRDNDVTVLGDCAAVSQYWNAGTPEVPSWQLDVTQFPGVVVCDYRAGDLGDLDSDGDADLVIGCYGGDLHTYWNDGTPDDPVWRHDPASLQGIVITPKPAPRLDDMDADGDLDMLVATDSQLFHVRYVENVGTPVNPQWVYRGWVQGITFTEVAYTCLGLGDLDGDGDLDVVGSDDDPTVQCWENVGSPQSFQFVENPSMLIGVEDIGPWPYISFGLDLLDIDADGDPDLLIDGWGRSYLYLNERTSSVEPRTWTWGAIKALYQ